MTRSKTEQATGWRQVCSCSNMVRESSRGTQGARAISLATPQRKNIPAEAAARAEAQGLKELGVFEAQLADQRLLCTQQGEGGESWEGKKGLINPAGGGEALGFTLVRWEVIQCRHPTPPALSTQTFRRLCPAGEHSTASGVRATAHPVSTRTPSPHSGPILPCCHLCLPSRTSYVTCESQLGLSDKI